MRCLAWLVGSTMAICGLAAHAEARRGVGVRGEVGLGGPGGYIAARALVPIAGGHRVQLEPGVGLASTGPGVGMLISIRLIDLDYHHRGTTQPLGALRVYVGGSATYQFSEQPRASVTPPHGGYGWLDAGLTLRLPLPRRDRLGILVGVNASRLLAGPDRSGMDFADSVPMFVPGWYVQQGMLVGAFVGLDV